MRLLSLYIEKYRVLEQLTINFGRTTGEEIGERLQPGYRLDFLVGLNGSGKSTVLHLLSRIFRNILLDEGAFPETVELRYSINGNIISASNVHNLENEALETPNRGGSFRFTVQYANDEPKELETRLPVEFRPAQVIVYTTGNEAALLTKLYESTIDDSKTEESFFQDEMRHLYELPGHERLDVDYRENEARNSLSFIQSHHLPLVTLCGLIASRKHTADTEILQPVLNSLNLEKLVGFSLRVQLDPSWTPESRPDVINKLEEIADHQTQQGADRLFVFNFDQDETKLNQILNLYSTSIEIFQRLYSLYQANQYQNPPLSEVNLFFRSKSYEEQSTIKNERQLYSYTWLSDGEQSFLGRMAMFSLFRAHNLLIMLDEPEVHFNDAWKREIVNMLHGIMKDQSSHALITTHSSIALTDVSKESIVVLQRDGPTTGGQNAASTPRINTLGADPSDVLVHVFGTGTAMGRRSISYIGGEIANSTSVGELEKLENIVAPGYWRYRIELEKQRLQPPNRLTS